MAPSNGPLRPNTTNTRSSSRLGTNDIIASKNEVSDVVSARTYLEKTAMAINGKPYTFNNISDILFHITQMPGVTLPAQLAIRAIAYLVEEAANIATANNVAKLVITAIAPHIANIQEVSESMMATASKMQANQDKINDTIISIDGNNANTIAGSASIDTRLANMQEAVTSLTTQVKEASQQQEDHNNSTKTYSAAVRQSTPTLTPVSAALIRAATKERQILLNPTPGSTLFGPDVSPTDIATKISQALAAAQSEESPAMHIKATTRLRNGGIIIELTTAEAAKWIRTPENRVTIINALDLPATIKDRRFSIIIPFLPTSSDIENEEWRRTIEQENEMSTGAIEAANWIKPSNRRAPGQRVAHAIFHFADPQAANNALRDGIYIGQEKLHPRKDKKEPVRCVKCQLWGHIARDCHAQCDTCGTCGKGHRTNECNTYKTFYCVSCDSQDHASWDRNCHEFANRCAGIDAKLPENSMPYFPTDVEWTQVVLPPKPAPYRKPPTQPTNAPPPIPTYRQSHLPFETRRPDRGTHPRGAPRHIGHNSTRAFTPTGSNSIPLTEAWGNPRPSLTQPSQRTTPLSSPAPNPNLTATATPSIHSLPISNSPTPPGPTNPRISNPTNV